MGKNNFFSGFTVFLLLVLFFFAFEAVARFMEDMDRVVVTKEFDPELGWRLKPGRHEVRPAGRLKTVMLEINSLGFRGPEFLTKKQGEKTILVLGDSFVFSRHFELSDTFTGQLETLLNLSAGAKTRVLNAGVPGYGTGQELLFMKRLAEERSVVPDTYILMIFLNDILDNLRLTYGERDEVAVKPGFELNAQGRAELKEMPVNDLHGLKDTFRRPAKPGFWTLRSVQFIRESMTAFFQANPALIRAALKIGLPVNLPRKPGLLNGWYDEQVVSQGAPLMKDLLRQMKEEAQERGAGFKAVIIPSPIQVHFSLYRRILTQQFSEDKEVQGWVRDPLKAQRLIAQMCFELGIDCLDLYPVFKENADKKLYLPRDGHFDRDAHELTAATLADWLKRFDAGETK